MKKFFSFLFTLIPFLGLSQQFQAGVSIVKATDVQHNSLGAGFFLSGGPGNLLFDISTEQIGFLTYDTDVTGLPVSTNVVNYYGRYMRTDYITSRFSLSVGYRIGLITPMVGLTTSITDEFDVYNLWGNVYGYKSHRHPKISDSFRFGIILSEKQSNTANLRFTYDTRGNFTVGMGITIDKWSPKQVTKTKSRTAKHYYEGSYIRETNR